MTTEIIYQRVQEDVLSPKCISVEEFLAPEIISQKVQDEDVISPKCNEDEYSTTEIVSQKVLDDEEEISPKCRMEEKFSATEIIS